ncbi:MAG: hypothetical protein HOY76_49375 [Streptomyces sp.]|nr:hypothetical protein [Streptomyces sp.]
MSGTTRLVTLGIGGNAIGFSSLITACVQAGLRYQLENRFGDPAPDQAPCKARYVSGGTDDLAAKIREAGGRLTGVPRRRGLPRRHLHVLRRTRRLCAAGRALVRALGPGGAGAPQRAGRARHAQAVLRAVRTSG